MPVPTLLLLLSLLAAPPLWADEGVVTLQQRPAEELLPLLIPFLEEGERAAGAGDRLILSASTARLQRLASIARGLDRPLRTLRLTLHRGTPPKEGRRVLRAGQPRQQRITLGEGEPVEIFDGVRETVVRRAVEGVRGRGVELEERERGRRLHARAWLIGEHAVVELWSRRETPGVEGIEVGEMSNRLRITPGHWLQLSGIEPGTDGDSRRGGRTFTTGDDDGIWLKVEPVGE